MKILLVSVLTFFMALAYPTASFAQNPSPTPNPPSGGNPSPAPNPPSGGVNGSESLINPLSGVSSVNDLLVAILNVLIIIATPIIVIFIILAGFKYVTAQGNPAKIEEAHKALTYAIIGGVLIIGAVAISAIVSDLVNAFR